MADATPMVSMHQVQKYFGSLHVLKDIDFEVAPGEVVVVIGPSGSGKSTLCRAINRLETIDCGTIEIEGDFLEELSKAPAPDVVFFDPFSKKTDTDCWFFARNHAHRLWHY